MSSLLKSIELPFVVLRFYDAYVVAKLKEGVVLGQQEFNELVEVCVNFYRGKKFVYISNRVNNYNVDPLVYLNLVKIETLAGLAVVCGSYDAIGGANFEKRFSKAPFEVFVEFEDAVEWARELLEK